MAVVESHERDRQQLAAQQRLDHQELVRAVQVADRAHRETAELVHEHEASVREFSARLQTVEDSSELVAAVQPISTHDLARTLQARLSKGDVLDQATMRDLRLSMDRAGHCASPPASADARSRMLQTPLTDASAAAENSIEVDEEESGEDAQNNKRHKRHRTLASRARQTTGSKTATDDENLRPNKRRNLPASRADRTADSKTKSNGEGTSSQVNGDVLLDTFTSAASSTSLLSQKFHGAGLGYNGEEHDAIIPPETRRSSRKSKPREQPQDMIHWRDANKLMRGIPNRT